MNACRAVVSQHTLGLDAIRAQHQVEVGVLEGAVAVLSDDHLIGQGPHLVEVLIPFAGLAHRELGVSTVAAALGLLEPDFRPSRCMAPPSAQKALSTSTRMSAVCAGSAFWGSVVSIDHVLSWLPDHGVDIERLGELLAH
jgi:hypothetical protein